MLAVRMPDGRMAFLTQPVPVTAELAGAAHEGPRAPEARFRFSSRCVQKACGQWTGSRCGIIDEVLVESGASVTPDDGAAGELPPCAIRATCRWFAQAGGAACGVCPEVVTDRR
jgi:hypothetical protein